MIKIKITKPNKVKIPLIIISTAAILFALLKPMSLDLKNAKTAITNDGTKKQIEYGTSVKPGVSWGVPGLNVMNVKIMKINAPSINGKLNKEQKPAIVLLFLTYSSCALSLDFFVGASW